MLFLESRLPVSRVLYDKKTVKIKHFVWGAYDYFARCYKWVGAIIGAGTDLTKSVLEL